MPDFNAVYFIGHPVHVDDSSHLIGAVRLWSLYFPARITQKIHT